MSLKATNTSLGQAIPFWAPKPAIREREILRISATLNGDDPNVAMRVACNEILNWAQNKAVTSFPRQAWDLQPFEQLTGGRSRVSVFLEDPSPKVWAIRVEDPDWSVAGRIWTTEISLISEGKETKCTVRQLVGSREPTLDEIEPHVPGFVRQLTSNPGLWSGIFRLTDRPLRVNSDEHTETLIRALLETSRTLPIIVLTVPSWAENPTKPLLDETTLAKACAGLAIVVVLPAQFTWKLTERFGKQLSVYEGAARIYQRGFTEDANPFGGHDLILPDRFDNAEGASRVLKRLRWSVALGSVTRLSLDADIPSFASLRLKSLEKQQLELQRSGASESDQREALQKRIEALETSAREAEGYLQQFSDLQNEAEERAQVAESQLRAAGYRIQQLLEQINAAGEEPDANISLPNQWNEFADWCDKNLAGRAVLSPQARRVVKDASFEDIGLAARCLLWLANEYRKLKIDQSDGSLRDRVIEPGITNAHCGNDQFTMDWQGRKCDVDWHIKNGGNTHNPVRCLRIYYFWDDQTQQAVVAYMPGHRRTDAT